MQAAFGVVPAETCRFLLLAHPGELLDWWRSSAGSGGFLQPLARAEVGVAGFQVICCCQRGEKVKAAFFTCAVSQDDGYSNTTAVRRERLCSSKCTAHLQSTSAVMPVGNSAVAGLLILEETPGACGL